MKYLDKDKTSQHVSDGKLSTGGKQSRNKPDMTEHSQKEGIAWFFVLMMTFFLFTYTFHCTWVTSEAYSSPSIVLSARSHDGSRIIFDDFREAYWWPIRSLLIIYSLRMSDFKLDLATDGGVLAEWLQPVLSLMRIIFTNLEAVFSTSEVEGEFLRYDDDDYNDFNDAHDDDQDTIMMIMMVTMLMSMMIMSLMMMIIMNTMIMNDDDNDDDLDVDDDDDAHDDDNDDE